MKKNISRFFLAITTALVIVLLAELALFVVNLRTQRRAELLLASLRKLKVSESTFEEVQPLLIAFRADKMTHGNCVSSDVGYAIHVGNSTIYELVSNHPLLLRIGVRPVGAGAVLSFAGGKLCDFNYGADALLAGSQFPSKDPYLNTSQIIDINADTTVAQDFGRTGPEVAHYEIRYVSTLLRGVPASGRTVGLRANLTPRATPSELDRALTFNLSCFTSWRGCRALCQVMPLVSQDAFQRQQTGGVHVPGSEIEFPGCSEIYRQPR